MTVLVDVTITEKRDGKSESFPKRPTMNEHDRNFNFLTTPPFPRACNLGSRFHQQLLFDTSP